MGRVMRIISKNVLYLCKTNNLSLVFGILFVLSGIVKAQDINALTKTNLFISDDLSVAILTWELCLGAMLIMGVWPNENLVLTLLTFFIFFSYHLISWINNSEICNCFGNIDLNHSCMFFLNSIFILLNCCWCCQVKSFLTKSISYIYCPLFSNYS